MTGKESAEERFNQAFIARTAAIRRLRGMTQAEMAKFLDIPLERYKKYEQRSPLPHYLLEKFAALTGTTVEAIVTGKVKESSRKIA